MIDARAEAATHALTLTTRDPTTPGEVYRDASAYVWKRLRRHFGRVDYFGSVEWTTGAGTRSGGLRRMHGHYLVKGLAGEDVRLIGGLTREAWEATTTNAGYGAWVVDASELMVAGAAIHYLNLHYRKAVQAPPETWRGMVERSSKGYWSQPVDELRRLATLELRAEAIAWATSIPLDEATFLVEQDAQARQERRDEVRRIQFELRELRVAGLTPAAAVTVDSIEDAFEQLDLGL